MSFALVTRALSSSIVFTTLAVYLVFHIYPKKESKSKGIKSGERRGHAVDPLSIHRPGKFAFRQTRTSEHNEQVLRTVEDYKIVPAGWGELGESIILQRV